MLDPAIKEFFVSRILKYYQEYKRDLPWRNTQDPYKIWISEIILQQTQVKQALPYYLKFIEKFPDVQRLANAKEEDVLHLWQGLGYYSRARNLHFAARQIMQQYNGRFPDKYEDIIQLKGIGEYTAAAIASFAFNLPYAVLDGNVFRVLSRFLGIDTPIDTSSGKKFFSRLAQEMLIKNQSAIYNQAIMEFGATQCKPLNPNCNNCLLNINCFAFLHNKVQHYPIKSKQIQKKNRFFNYIIFIEKNKYTYISKREQTDIWKSLYEFHLIETPSQLLSIKKINEYLKKQSVYPEKIKVINKQQHVLSHQLLYLQFILINIGHVLQTEHLKRIELKDVFKYPYPVPIQKTIRKYLTNF